jgi:hypothetical protein
MNVDEVHRVDKGLIFRECRKNKYTHDGGYMGMILSVITIK